MNIARKLKMPQRKLDSLESYLLVISAETFFFKMLAMRGLRRKTGFILRTIKGSKDFLIESGSAIRILRVFSCFLLTWK